jgi:uncharacterized membrane protein
VTKTEQLLKETFSMGIRQELTTCLRDAYEASITAHEPEVGHDAMSFGLLVYKSNVFILGQLAERVDWMTVTTPAPSFEFQIGEYAISCYSAGHTDTVDAKNSFPNNRTRAGRIAEANSLQARLFEDLWDDSACRQLILAHKGNPDEGLLEVFVAVPVTKGEDGRVKEWGTVYTLWSRGIEGEEGIPGSGPTAPPENVAPFRPSLRKKKSETNEEQ